MSQSSHNSEQKANQKPSERPRLTRSERERERKQKASEWRDGHKSEKYRLTGYGLQIAVKAKLAFTILYGRSPLDYEDWKLAVESQPDDKAYSIAAVLAVIIVKSIEAGTTI